MTASAPAPAKKNVDTEVQYAESVIAWNVKMLLTAQNKSQSALAAFLGIQRPTMTNKMKGRIAWSVADLVKSADFLGTTAEALMDDSLMSQLKTGYTESAKPEYGVFAEKPGALVGVGAPRFLVSPFNPDAPVEGGISGAAKGALAGFVPSVVPSGSSSPSMPSKHDGIGVPGRSQAHETLGTMTTIIMRTSHDNRMWSFSALFQGFPIFGKPADQPRFPRDTYRHSKIIREHSTVPAGAWHLRQSPESPTILALRGITSVTTPSENALRRIRRQPTIHFVHRTQTSTCR